MTKHSTPGSRITYYNVIDTFTFFNRDLAHRMRPSPQWKKDDRGNYTIHDRDLILLPSGKVGLPFAGKVNYYEFKETRGSGDNILYKEYVFTGPGSRKTTYRIDHSSVPMDMSINEDYEYEKPGGFDHMST